MSFPQHNQYKEADSSWVEEIPVTWEVARLGFEAETLVPMRDKPENLDGEVPWIRIEDFQGKYISTSKSGQGVSEDTISSMNLRVFPVGTVLCSCSCSMGATAIAEAPLVSNQTFIGIVPGKSYKTEYLYYLLQASSDHLNSIGTGAIQSYLSRDDFRRLRLPKPPVKEQAQVANFLDRETAKIDDLIAEQERLIELLQEKRQAVISHAVTKGLNPNAPMKDSGVEWLGEVPEHWAAKPLKYFCKITTGFAFKSEDFVDTGIPLLRISNITREGSVNLEDAKFLDPSKLEENPDKAILQGDLVMAMTGATIGKVGRYESQEIALLNQRVCIFRTLENSNRQYLFLLLQSRAYQEHIFLTAFGGAQPNISDKELLEKSLPLPPLHEQQEISQEVENKTGEIQNTIKESNKLINILNERRSALISAAVTGQIDVRGLVTERETA